MKCNAAAQVVSGGRTSRIPWARQPVKKNASSVRFIAVVQKIFIDFLPSQGRTTLSVSLCN